MMTRGKAVLMMTMAMVGGCGEPRKDASAGGGGVAAAENAAAENAAAENAAAPKAALTRDQVAETDRWNLRDIFTDEDGFEESFRKVEGMIDVLVSLKGTLGDSAEAMHKALAMRDDALQELERVVLYAGLAYHEDMSVGEAQGRWDRVQSLGTRINEAISWFVPEALMISPETVHAWMAEDERFAVYRHAIDDIHRQKEHYLSPREEELLAMAGEVTAAPGNIFGRFTNTDLDFPTIKDERGDEIELSSAVYYQLLYSPDRRVRRDAFLGLHETYAAKENSLSAMLSAQVKQHIFYAKARHHASSLEAALSEPNIPVEVYHNLIATVNKNVHRLHRYVALRKKLMKLEDLHRFDLYVPMVAAEQEKIEYGDAISTILRALKPLGDDYVGTLANAFKSRWIDVYPTKNKRSGAYCWGGYLTHPYLLLNYTGTMNDRSTIAHEMGHAMHSWYTVKKQPFVYGDYATFCAEVASTVNEVLLAHHLLDNAKSDIERLLILQQQIDGIRTTVFRQTMFAEFELKIHEMAEKGEPLTGPTLRRLYGDLVRTYYGPEIVMDDSASAECLRIPHFYRNFYVFTYATSHCAATNIGRRIIDGETGALEGLMDFLSAGSSRYPLNVSRLAGVDMTTPKPIEDTLRLFSDLLDQFERIYERTSAKG